MNESSPHFEDRRGVLDWLLRHPKSTIALAIFLMLVLTVLALQKNAENALARRIEAIKARGEPVSVADLIALQPKVPDEENMVLQLNNAGAAIKQFTIPDDKVRLLPFVGTAPVLPPTGESWPVDHLEASKWYLQQNATSLQAVHKACRLKRSSLIIPWASPAINTPYMAGMSEIREVAKSLTLEAAVAAEIGDSDRAGTALQDMCNLSNWSADGVLLHYLVKIAIDSLTLNQIERTINRCPLTEARLKELQSGVAGMGVSHALRRALLNERVVYLDSITSVRKGKIPRGSLGPGPSILPFVPLILTWDSAAGLDAYGELIGLMSDPIEGRISRIKAIENSPALVAWYSVLSKMLMPSLTRAAELGFRTEGQARAMVAAIAAERFRLATGRWPGTLNELVPAYLDAGPADPIDGKPIRYAIIPEGIKTWTISDDNMNQDDGGDVQRIEAHRTRPKDWGWVIINPELRGRPAPAEKPPVKKTATSSQGR